MTDLHVVILAAGKSTRMKSAEPKVLHALGGRRLIDHVLENASALGAASTTVVVGHEADRVKDALSNRHGLVFAAQSPQLGTGHALMQAEAALAGRSGIVLLLYADVPLLSLATLTQLIATHRDADAHATVLTARMADPAGYGRIVRDGKGRIARIVEQRDASPEERRIDEINSGIYVLSLGPLFESLRCLATNNAQGEYYLTDLIAQYREANRRVETLCIDDGEEIRGVNTRVDLADLGVAYRARKNRALMLAGVTMEDPASTYIDAAVRIAPDTEIGSNVHLEGSTSIGSGCRILAGSRLSNATIGDRVTILDHSIITDSVVESGARIGPFTHLRPQSHVGSDAHVGNFVELKKTRMGKGAKAGHLAYLGDATIGSGVNIGAGVITCNYDGETKHQTVIEENAFVGSDSQLIAPVTVGRGAYVGTGTTVREDVPAGALAVSAGKQRNIEGWVENKKNRKA